MRQLQEYHIYNVSVYPLHLPLGEKNPFLLAPLWQKDKHAPSQFCSPEQRLMTGPDAAPLRLMAGLLLQSIPNCGLHIIANLTPYHALSATAKWGETVKQTQIRVL